MELEFNHGKILPTVMENEIAGCFYRLCHERYHQSGAA